MSGTVKNREKPEAAAPEAKVQTGASGKTQLFCEGMPTADAGKQASVRIEPQPDIAIEIRCVHRSLLEEYAVGPDRIIQNNSE